ncbi:hypothetical protein [Actinomycetospora atypica]|uniref:SWIM-type domain-containing protein n=1 Tax=Actinomycetospora atypica TaxID=1290095 RepID=A0ABV9YLY1_9PSEU
MLNEFGTTARGRAWLRLAEPLRVTRPDPRLPRARSLARNDRVGALGTEPGRVVATVDDGRPRRVEVVFPVWDDEARATAATVLAAAAEDGAVAELAAAGVPLVPDDAAVRVSCDCGRTGRCVHALAVLIELARRVDEAPDLAATLRGSMPRWGAGDTTRIRIADLDPGAFWTVTTP